jgi:hypothetical protein
VIRGLRGWSSNRKFNASWEKKILVRVPAREKDPRVPLKYAPFR